MEYEYHPVANIFPLMQGIEFDSLVSDIRRNGLLEPIWLYQGKIIDGRNRYRACLVANIPPRFREWEGKGSLIGFILSLNLNRRHLDSVQKAIAAENALPFYASEAKERMRKTQIKAGKTPIPAPQIVALPSGEAAEILAKAFGTNKEYIRTIKRMTQEQKKAIMNGEVDGTEIIKQMKTTAFKERIRLENEHIGKLTAPTGKFNVIVIDPPWKDEGGEYDPEFRRQTPPYPTMTFEEIKALKLPMEDDCIVWVWGIDLYLKETLEIIQAWGLTKKSTLIWAKDRFGLGSTLRMQHEYAFLCFKGRPVFHGESASSILYAPRGKHSEKPEEFYKMVEATCPYPRKLDYFARKKRDGWAVYGTLENEKKE